MKNRRNVSVLAALTLMVSTMVLFTGCNQIYKKKLIGVWEVEKVSGVDLPPSPVDAKVYAYFTDDGTCGTVAKVTQGAVSGIFKGEEAKYEFNNPKLTIKIIGESLTLDCKFSGKKLILKGKSENEEVSIELKKVSSPSLNECKNAKKPTGIGG